MAPPLLSSMAPPLPQQRPTPLPFRPLLPQEAIPLGGGQQQTEVTMTFQDPQTGQWVNVPSIWMTDGGPVTVQDEEQLLQMARMYEQFQNVAFPRFKSVEDAETAARKRSLQGGVLSGPLAQPAQPPGVLGNFPRTK
jgi:hypothetical protein